MDRETWWATVQGVTKSQTQLSATHRHRHTHTHTNWALREGRKVSIYEEGHVSVGFELRRICPGLRGLNDTTLMAETEELKSLLMKVKRRVKKLA